MAFECRLDRLAEKHMSESGDVSRRKFFTATSAAIAVGGLAGNSASAEPASSPTTGAAKLAIDGGPKTVQEALPPLVRWGDPEREQLSAAVDQNTMFYWQGPQTKLFIERFRKFCPLDHVMTCSSGTAACHIAVAAAGIGPGDEVITTPITDIGTVIGVIYQQGVPVFADLSANTYNLDPEDVERKITPRTKAIIAVHLAGNPCRMDELRAIADKHKLVLIEDCAQAWGARYRDRPIGTLGHIACFSLQQSKQVTCGDGGVVASSDERFGPLLQRYGDKGADRLHGSGVFERFSTNYRMSELQAAFAAAQLERLEKIADTRQRLGNALTAKISGFSNIVPHGVDAADRATYWFYMFRVQPEGLSCDRAQFVKALAAEGVPASAGYIPVPMYGNPVFKKHGFFAGRWPIREMGLTEMDYSKVSCPETEAILTSGVRIIIHEGMSDSYVASVGDAIRKVAEHYSA
jgi:dTDP-4-amino-4,6-dideoxygalactose transaminase